LWSNGQTTATATGLAAGIYTVTVTDANGCTEIATGTVNEPTELTLTGMETDVECNGDATGAINITVGGGTPGYTYLWSNGATTEDLTGLTAGIYSVTVTDANDCTIEATFEVEESTDLEATIADTDVLCNGDTDGTLTVVVTGGTPDYTYLWSNGQTTATATGLAAGTYTVTVTDANGCTEIATGTVNEPTDLE
ncbi:SprB repeat-containing protein, partial [Lewinella lacunae]